MTRSLYIIGIASCLLVILVADKNSSEWLEVVHSQAVVDPHPFRGVSPAEFPSPTEVLQWKEDRREYKRKRAEWVELMHRSPGVDWREVERENRRAASLERMARDPEARRLSRWTEIGSANQAGHSRAAAPNADGTELYVGSAAGGVWRGSIDGQGWAPISDGLGLGSSQLLVVPEGGPSDPEVVFSLSRSGNFATIHATSDGGSTWWVPNGLPDVIYEWKRIALDPAHPRHVYFLSRSGELNGNGQLEYRFRLSRSTNGGFDWVTVYTFPSIPKCDLWIDRINGGDIYVMAGEDMYRSTDQADSFQLMGSAGVGSITNLKLTGSEAGGPTFYAAFLISGSWQIHRSTDAGQTWAFANTATDMWDSIVASISDPDVVIYGSVEAWRSTNGGSSFAKINNWYDYYDNVEFRLHADIRGLDAYPVGNEDAIFINTDGGTYVSYDNGATVQNLSLEGLGISQYYGTFTSSTDPYLVAAGAQDQGYQVSEYAGDPYLPFDQWISGDYGHLTSTFRDLNLLFCTYPGFILYQRAEQIRAVYQLNYPTGASSLWLPRVVADPVEEGDFYFVGDKIYKYTRNGPSFSWTISDFAQNGAGLYAGFEISPVDVDHMVAVKDNGAIWRTTNGGANWSTAGLGPDGHSWFGTSIEASPNDANLFYAAGSAYLGAAVWRSFDGGLNWEPIGEGLPSTLVYEVALGGTGGDQLFAATEAGPYAYVDGIWVSLYGTEAPITSYWSVEWVPEINSMRFGTYGRGIWDYELLSPAAVPGNPEMAGRLDFDLFPNPARSNISVQFQLGREGRVDVEVFDVTGRRVFEVPAQRLSTGSQVINLEPSLSLARGTYLVRLRTPEGVAVKKIQLVD